jgi:hypothetical protein
MILLSFYYSSESWDLLIRDFIRPCLAIHSIGFGDYFLFFKKDQGDHVILMLEAHSKSENLISSEIAIAANAFILANPSADKNTISLNFFMNYPNNAVTSEIVSLRIGTLADPGIVIRLISFAMVELFTYEVYTVESCFRLLVFLQVGLIESARLRGLLTRMLCEEILEACSNTGNTISSSVSQPPFPGYALDELFAGLQENTLEVPDWLARWIQHFKGREVNQNFAGAFYSASLLICHQLCLRNADWIRLSATEVTRSAQDRFL